jgi:membrane protease YdiL (CAAX protease family)
MTGPAATLVIAAVVLGGLALAGRPAEPAGIALVSVLVGAGGLAAPLPGRGAAAGPAGAWRAAAVGVAAVIGARLVSGPPAVTYGVAAAAAACIAAIAEETFFRRMLYGWLDAWGPAVAIGVTALAFAAVHVPSWGAAALPVNLAAGALLGWQRWASGTWLAPAATHAAANLLQMIA